MSKLEQQLAEMRDYALRLECFCPECKPCVKMLRASADAIEWQQKQAIKLMNAFTKATIPKYIDQLAAKLGEGG